MKFCECVVHVRRLCVQILCREVYVRGYVWYFVECVVWWLIWVVFVVRFGGSVV